MGTVKSVKGYRGLPMEGPVANWYAKATFKDMNRHTLMAEQLTHKISAGSSVLEIAPGPGYFCIELAKLGNYQITGLDISKSFVEIARKNAAEAGVTVDFQQGNASDMPFANDTFDLTVCQAAFKNFAQPVQAIADMYRVLRQGGIAVIADLRRDTSPEEIEQHIKCLSLNRVDQVITRWTFNQVLLKSAYSIEDMESIISQTPFSKGKIDLDGIGFQVWLKK